MRRPVALTPVALRAIVLLDTYAVLPAPCAGTPMPPPAASDLTKHAIDGEPAGPTASAAPVLPEIVVPRTSILLPPDAAATTIPVVAPLTADPRSVASVRSAKVAPMGLRSNSTRSRPTVSVPALALKLAPRDDHVVEIEGCTRRIRDALGAADTVDRETAQCHLVRRPGADRDAGAGEYRDAGVHATIRPPSPTRRQYA